MSNLFALHLDHDGIALSRGEEREKARPAALDAPDFAQQVAAMQAEVAAACGGHAECTLVLPDSQVLYTQVAASGLDGVADEARVRSALEGQTPYQIEELAFDWHLEGQVIHIAAVACETLEEALTFARDYGFHPIAITAERAQGYYPVAPSFALPASAGDTGQEKAPTVPEDVKTPAIEPEPDPAEAVPPSRMTEASVPAGEEQTSSADAAAEEGPRSDEAAASEDVPAEMASIASPPAEVEDAASVPPTSGASGMAFSSIRARAPDPMDGQSGTDMSGPARPEIRAVRAGEVAEGLAGSLAPVPPRAPDIGSERGGRGEGSRSGPLARLALGFGSMRGRSGESREAGPESTPPVTSQTADLAPGEAQATPVRPESQESAAREGATHSVLPEVQDDQSQGADAAPIPAVGTGRRAGSAIGPAGEAGNPEIRRIQAPTTLPAESARAPSTDPSLKEAESLTVFGARRQKSEAAARRASRSLGLSLTAALLAIMGLVALWSLWFGEADVSNAIAGASQEEQAEPSPLEQAIERAVEEADQVPESPVTPLDASVAPATEDPAPTTAEATDSASDAADAAPAEAPPELAEAAAPETVPETAATEEPAPQSSDPVADVAQVQAAEAPAPGSVPDDDVAATDAQTPALDAAETAPEAAPPADLEQPTVTATTAERGATSGVSVVAEAGSALRLASVEPETHAASATPLSPAPARDAPPPVPGDPLPPGTYRGDDGFIIPTEEGALAPGGYSVRAGPPPIIPPVRPGDAQLETLEAPSAPEQTDSSLEEGPDAQGPEDAQATDATEPAPNPLSDFRPRARPEAFADLAEEAEGASAPATDLALRPSARPEPVEGTEPTDATVSEAPPEPDDPAATELAESETDAPETEASEGPSTALAGARPRTRPASLAEQAEAIRVAEARAAEVAAEEARAAAEALAAEEAAQAAALASATALAVEASLPPRGRPQSVIVAVQRARAAAAAAEAEAEAERTRQAEAERASQAEASTARAAEPAAEAPEAPARTQTAAAPAAAAATPPPRRSRGPLVARNQRVQPSVPSSAQVARQATQRNALRMADVTLIGVYGSPSQRRALVRLPSGRYVKVQVGDRMDGGQVAAISQNEVRYIKRGRSVVLRMPSG